MRYTTRTVTIYGNRMKAAIDLLPAAIQSYLDDGSKKGWTLHSLQMENVKTDLDGIMVILVWQREY